MFFSILYHIKTAHHKTATLANCHRASFFLGSASIAGNHSANCSENLRPILEEGSSGFAERLQDEVVHTTALPVSKVIYCDDHVHCTLHVLDGVNI